MTRDELGRVARDNADEPRPGRPDLASIRKRAEAATPGPIAVDAMYGSAWFTLLAPTIGQIADVFGFSDAHFFAYARTDVPDLLAYCEWLEAAVEESDNHSVIWSRGIATVAIEQRDVALTRVGRLEAAGDALAAIVERTARVANLPEERAAVAAWRAARGEGGQGHIWRNGDA